MERRQSFQQTFESSLISRVRKGAKSINPYLIPYPKISIDMDYEWNYKGAQIYSIKTMFNFRIYYRKVSSCFQIGEDFINNIQNTLNVKGKKSLNLTVFIFKTSWKEGERKRPPFREWGSRSQTIELENIFTTNLANKKLSTIFFKITNSTWEKKDQKEKKMDI